jgi:sugar/nucleoside kinase (ribokinase family)
MNDKSVCNPDIYLYGMTVLSTIHLLDGTYPKADTYCEIKETYQIPGGETANSAIVLANFGYSVKFDGPFLGTKTKEAILDFAGKYRIDCSGLQFDPGFDGVQDLVLIDKHSRTVFGKFKNYFEGPKRWSRPDEAAMRSAGIVSLDPFFGDESKLAAEYCAAINQRYVTIDCPPDGIIHQNAAATVISNEFIQNQFPGVDIRELMQKYTETSNGLVTFTFGAREILYGRKSQAIQSVTPYRVDVKSTLGAGDTFRAGVVYGVLNEMDDETTVKFAAATAASVCKRFPMALDPPGLEEIMGLMRE